MAQLQRRVGGTAAEGGERPSRHGLHKIDGENKGKMGSRGSEEGESGRRKEVLGLDPEGRSKGRMMGGGLSGGKSDRMKGFK